MAAASKAVRTMVRLVAPDPASLKSCRATRALGTSNLLDHMPPLEPGGRREYSGARGEVRMDRMGSLALQVSASALVLVLVWVVLVLPSCRVKLPPVSGGSPNDVKMASTDPVGAAGFGVFFSFVGGAVVVAAAATGAVPAVLLVAAEAAGGGIAFEVALPTVPGLEADVPVCAGAAATVADGGVAAGAGAGADGGSWPALAPPSSPPALVVAGAGGVVIFALCPKKIRDVR